MPLYEYMCLNCRRRVTVFFRSMAAARDEDARCPLCDGAQLQRLISLASVVRSEARRLEELADPRLMAGLEQEDPQALAQFMRQMSAEAGESLGDELTETVERLEAGTSLDAFNALDEPMHQPAASNVAPSPPDVAQPDVAQPDVAQPDFAQSDAAQSNAVQPSSPPPSPIEDPGRPGSQPE